MNGIAHRLLYTLAAGCVCLLAGCLSPPAETSRLPPLPANSTVILESGQAANKTSSRALVAEINRLRDQTWMSFEGKTNSPSMVFTVRPADGGPTLMFALRPDEIVELNGSLLRGGRVLRTDIRRLPALGALLDSASPP